MIAHTNTPIPSPPFHRVSVAAAADDWRNSCLSHLRLSIEAQDRPRDFPPCRYLYAQLWMWTAVRRTPIVGKAPISPTVPQFCSRSLLCASLSQPSVAMRISSSVYINTWGDRGLKPTQVYPNPDTYPPPPPPSLKDARVASWSSKHCAPPAFHRVQRHRKPPRHGMYVPPDAPAINHLCDNALLLCRHLPRSNSIRVLCPHQSTPPPLTSTLRLQHLPHPGSTQDPAARKLRGGCTSSIFRSCLPRSMASNYITTHHTSVHT